MEGMGTDYTKRLEAVADDLQESLQHLVTYTAENLEEKLTVLERNWRKSGRTSAAEELFRVLDELDIPYQRNQPLPYYRQLVRKAIQDGCLSEKAPPPDDQVLQILYRHYREYPTPSDYMRRIVDRLASDPWESDSLRLRILKQFIKYGDYLRAADFGGRTSIRQYANAKRAGGKKSITDAEVLELLDDAVFDVLKTAGEDQLGPRGAYGLLKLADDLSDGKFRSGGATRKGLYLFAMVYGMTYCPGGENSGELFDYETDIVKNLFQDYYSDNPMRFITDAYQENLSAYETPSDQGINVNNFAEIVYLYYIRQDCTPQEKISRSSKMIDRLKKSQTEPVPENISEPVRGRTRHHRELIGEDGPDKSAWALPEDLFEAFVRTNYSCNTRMNKTAVGPLQKEIGQNTAYQLYREILGELGDLSQYNYGLFCADAAVLEKYEAHCRESLGAVPEDFEQFKKLLLAVNGILGHTVHEEVSGLTCEQEWQAPARAVIDALSVDSPGKMSRTAMITAYYYYFNKMNERCLAWDIGDFWLVFTEELNGKLKEAYYPLMSTKNIFDVLTVISSYIHLTD